MPFQALVDDYRTDRFIKLSHLFGGFLHRCLHLFDKLHSSFGVHRKVAGHGGHLKQQVRTQTQVDGHSLKVQKLQTVVVRPHVHVETVVAAQTGYVIQQICKILERTQLLELVNLLQAETQLLGIYHLVDLTGPFLHI